MVTAIERCPGHDGTYAVKSEFHESSMKIAKPVANRIKRDEANFYGSDCPMAGHRLGKPLGDGAPPPSHPLGLLKMAYGI